MLESLTLDTFTPHIGSTFHLRVNAEQTLDLQLLDARSLAGTAPAGASEPIRREPFALTFMGPPREYAPQRIYPLDHDVLGRHELFIVPLGPRDGGIQYEVIFA